MGTPFTKADPTTEAVWATIVTTKVAQSYVSEVDWHLDEQVAQEAAEYAVQDAMDGEYRVDVYVVKLVRKSGTDSDGKIK